MSIRPATDVARRIPEPDVVEATERIRKLIEQAPAGSIFHGAVCGPVRTLSDGGKPMESTFPIFWTPNAKFDVTLKRSWTT